MTTEDELRCALERIATLERQRDELVVELRGQAATADSFLGPLHAVGIRTGLATAADLVERLGR